MTCHCCEVVQPIHCPAMVLYNIKIKFMGIRLAALRQKCYGGVELYVMKKKTETPVKKAILRNQ